MPTKWSLKEGLERRDGARAKPPARSDSPAVRLILRAAEIAQPVDLVRLLARHGHSLRKAHEILQRLTAGERVAVELQSTSAARLRAELAKLGIVARSINLP